MKQNRIEHQRLSKNGSICAFARIQCIIICTLKRHKISHLFNVRTLEIWNVQKSRGNLPWSNIYFISPYSKHDGCRRYNLGNFRFQTNSHKSEKTKTRKKHRTMWVALLLNPKHAYQKTRNKGKGKQRIHFRQIGKPTVCLHALNNMQVNAYSNHKSHAVHILLGMGEERAS